MTARRRSGLSQIRRSSYFLSRDIGDWQAAARGPKPLAKRLIRRKLTRALFRSLR